ncbi:MAG TPA: hypothetical protein VIU41_05690 [Geobacteraceae bacterium]
MAKRSKLMAVMAAGVLTVATAVPALALENEFHGSFRAQYQVSNFNGSTTGQGFFDPSNGRQAPTGNTFDQRARLYYTAKANDNVKLVTAFELDYTFWGNSSYTVGRNQGGAIGSDTVNLETKNVYLDLKVPSTSTTLRIGMQPFDDAFKGVFVSADMVGIQATASYDKSTALLGFYRFDDQGSYISTGKKTRDMFALDYKYELSKHLKLGGAYYYVNDDRGTGEPSFLSQQSGLSNQIHTMGVNGETTMGPLTLDGFFLYQFGTMDAPASNHINAFAGNVGARLKAGPGTARSEFLYTSGDKTANRTDGTTNAYQSINSTNNDTENGFYNNEMVILGRDKYALTIDNAIVYSSNNKDQGMIFGSVGYDLPITSKFSTSVNAGFAAVAKENGNKPINNNTGKRNSSDYLGTELNVEASYAVYEGVTAVARAAYVVLGDYYRGTANNGNDPDNPYGVRFLVQYAF